MAQLPNSNLLIQQNYGIVSIFDRYSQEVYFHFNPANADETARTMAEIWHDGRMSDEDKCFAIFWSGYFYAHAEQG